MDAPLARPPTVPLATTLSTLALDNGSDVSIHDSLPRLSSYRQVLPIPRRAVLVAGADKRPEPEERSRYRTHTPQGVERCGRGRLSPRQARRSRPPDADRSIRDDDLVGGPAPIRHLSV